MRKIGLLFVLAMAFFALNGCGVDGKVYGSIDWTYTPTVYYFSNSGFPSSVVATTEYTIAKGDYYFYYDLYDGYSTSSYYYVSYTVTPNPGGIILDGKDKHFEIYLSWYGPDLTGLSVNALKTQANTLKPGEVKTEVKEFDGFTVRLSYSIAEMTADQKKNGIQLK